MASAPGVIAYPVKAAWSWKDSRGYDAAFASAYSRAMSGGFKDDLASFQDFRALVFSTLVARNLVSSLPTASDTAAGAKRFDDPMGSTSNATPSAELAEERIPSVRVVPDDRTNFASGLTTDPNDPRAYDETRLFASCALLRTLMILDPGAPWTSPREATTVDAAPAVLGPISDGDVRQSLDARGLGWPGAVAIIALGTGAVVLGAHVCDSVASYNSVRAAQRDRIDLILKSQALAVAMVHSHHERELAAGKDETPLSADEQKVLNDLVAVQDAALKGMPAPLPPPDPIRGPALGFDLTPVLIVGGLVAAYLVFKK